jgi:hypothetical protein
VETAGNWWWLVVGQGSKVWCVDFQHGKHGIFGIVKMGGLTPMKNIWELKHVEHDDTIMIKSWDLSYSSDVPMYR